MEFPTLGEHCNFEECNQTDFLPLQCKCGKIFCREHYNDHCLSGICELAPKAKEAKKNTDPIFKCSQKDCRISSYHEMICEKCAKHYCVVHRFHPSCPEVDDSVLAAKKEQFEAPRKQFQEANKHLQDKITESIRQALKSSAKVKTASKIHLMRIKQKAVGSKAIGPNERVYFAVTVPKNTEAKEIKIVSDPNNLKPIESVTLDPNLKDCIPIFTSVKYSLGRAIDSLCEYSNVTNENNKLNKVKIRLFRQLDGYCISPIKMESTIEELMKQEILLEGDRLILEYISNDVLSNINECDQIFLCK